MEKEGKRSCQTSPESQEVIEANKNSKLLSCDSAKTPINGYSAKEEDSNSSSNSFLSSSSSSSSDLMEDASSSSSSNGPLFQLSDLMAQLPIKRGLSKYYEGKTQSFTSLTSVVSLEDLSKRQKPYKKRIKLCKSTKTSTTTRASFPPTSIFCNNNNK